MCFKKLLFQIAYFKIVLFKIANSSIILYDFYVWNQFLTKIKNKKLKEVYYVWRFLCMSFSQSLGAFVETTENRIYNNSSSSLFRGRLFPFPLLRSLDLTLSWRPVLLPFPFQVIFVGFRLCMWKITVWLPRKLRKRGGN